MLFNKHFLTAASYAMLAFSFACGFSACSDDDDDDNGGGSKSQSAMIDGAKVGLSYAHYYKIDDETMYIELFSCDILGGSVPQTYSYVLIEYETSASTPESVTIPAGSYHIEMEKDWKAIEVMLTEPYYYSNASSSDSELVIVKDGGKYTITVESATLELKTDYFDENLNWLRTEVDPNPHIFSLNYTGSIVAAPTSYLEQQTVVGAEQVTGLRAILRDDETGCRVYDMTGRPVERPTQGGVYIIRRADGSSRKVLMK